MGRAQISLLFAICAAAAAAQAEQATTTPAIPAGVQAKLYRMSNRWEVGATFSTAVNTPLVNETGAMVSVTYHPNEWADFGVDVLANRTSLSSVVGQIRAGLPPRTNALTGQPNRGDEISNSDQLRHGALVVGRISPIYGKLNLASELAVHFQAFLLGGVGAAAFRHESVNLCASPGGSPCTGGDFQTSTSIQPLGEAGAGMRVYLGQRWSLRGEFRGFVFPASAVRDADLTHPDTGNTKKFLGFIATLGIGVSAVF
ncbi:MAG TPA: outer membrane beta-barrel domain-containing protein [Myxococcales bacterium]|jgi:outer membrane beta-barrel protein|nr:outer membrane beta-barrel domain-containing protein [Myxococcales bacterium]